MNARPLLEFALVAAVLAPGAHEGVVAWHGQSTSVARQGGAATVGDTSPNAFGFPAPTLDWKERRRFLVGNSFFKQNWIEAPASASERDGLGPLFNARSCSACHLRDGRSAPPAPTDRDRHGLLLRIGVRQPDGPDRPHPVYGSQVQDVAIRGAAPEGRTVIRHEPLRGAFDDGTPYELLQPRYALEDLGYGALGDGVALGPRIAPPLIGLGLLEAVPAKVLEALADPDDRDGDGISGRVHYLDPDRTTVGRFGWKATQATVADQVAAAFVHDMGITSELQPVEPLTDAQRELRAESGARAEIRAETFDKVVFYTAMLAVPAERGLEDDRVRRGREVFDSVGCVACHVPTLQTGVSAHHPSYASQTIAPFSDLLLHDMGPGLADDKRDGRAAPAEWRTPPLWGIGLTETVSGVARYLHDGRARSLTEAILWHGGEARGARERFTAASQLDREALLAFLRSR